MPAYDYKCKKCETVVEIVHPISQDILKEFDCPTCNNKQECSRLISLNHCNVIFKGNGWTVKSSGFGARGYKGKFQDKTRPIGTTVDAPANKREADKQTQRWIDTGGLDGIKPTFDMTNKNDPRRPKTADEMVEKKQIKRNPK